MFSGDGAVLELEGDTEESDQPSVTRVDIQGPLEQRSGYHDMCAGWSDGHDAVTERMIAALETGDVVMVIDSPGGSYAGLQEGVRRVQEAKAAHGRHVIAYADELIGSAAYWWAACVADEIYGPPSMVVGSIGARFGHGSIAGALAKEGVAVTFFAWPEGGGKVAFAPELPLSEIGKERGNRDISFAGESFAAAIGPCRGLSRDQIVKLNADVLHGKLALENNLVDGIASLEDVMDYALAVAGTSTTGETDMTIAKPGQTAARTEDSDDEHKPKKPGDEEETRTEDDAPEKPAADKHECDKCGAANDDDAKYCDKCGEKLHESKGENDDAETTTESDDDDEEETSTEAPKPAESRPAASAAVQAARAGSIAAILGLRDNASVPQVKKAVMAYVSLGRAVMSATDTKSPDEAAGAFRAIADDAAEANKLRGELSASNKRETYRERVELLRQLASADLPGFRRGDLFVDKEVAGKLVPSPAPAYAEMKIGTLRGFVQGKLASPSAKKQAKSPFEPNRPAASALNEAGQVAIAVETPFVREIASRSTASPEQIARTAAALDAQQQGV